MAIPAVERTMPNTLVVAQRAASGDQATGRSLHLTSRFRGRLEALEAALVSGDRRQQCFVLIEMADLFEELNELTLGRAAA